MRLSDEEIDRLYIDPIIALLLEGKDISGVPNEQISVAQVILFSRTLINGGLLQYLIDTKGEHVSILKNGLLEIGESSAASLVQQALKIFLEHLERVPRDQDFRIVLSGNEALGEAIGVLEKQMPDAVDLYKKAIQRARNQLPKFVPKR